jgi:hypothetical protein
VKFAADRPFADPDVAARELIEITVPSRRCRTAIYIELVNDAFLKAGGTPGEYQAGIDRAIAKGWLWRHESGTYVKFTPVGAGLFM